MNKGLVALFLASIVILFFQNCGPQFKANDSTSLGSNSQSGIPRLVQAIPDSDILNSSTVDPARNPSVLNISKNVLGSTLKIGAHTNFSYAIHSLTFRGKEFIDSLDHGRELQSASSFDGYGECFNPTEAGSRDDGGIQSKGKSLSVGYSILNNVLTTRTDMAFWLAPGTNYGGNCGSRTDYTQALNRTERGNHLLDKRVTIGFAGIENAIEYVVTFHVPEAHTQGGTFEALTGYMPNDFSAFWSFDPSSNSLSTLSDGPGEQSLPVILATRDSNFAMGVYSPELPQNQFLGAGYGRFRFPDTTKWNCVFREISVLAKDYTYRCYVVIGTLAEVQRGLSQVYQVFHPGSTPSGSTTTTTTMPSDLPAAQLIKIYRFFNGSDNFETAVYDEGINAGYVDQNDFFQIYTVNGSGKVPIYRCIVQSTGDHFVSLDNNCENEKLEGQYGFVYSQAQAGLKPLFRFRSVVSGDHAVTSLDVGDNGLVGYVKEGILGYVP